MKRTSWSRKATRRPKRPSSESLHKKAWNVFSKWVRERDKHCVTCGSRKDEQAGHFWHNVLDFDEMNINQQCSQCNFYKSGNLAIYSTYLLNKYGLEKFMDLEKRHYLALRGEYRTDKDYQDIIEKYQAS